MPPTTTSGAILPNLALGKRRGSSASPHIDQLPPHSIEAECGVLGCILMTPDCMGEVMECLRGGAAAFYDLRHQAICAAMMQLHRNHSLIDLLTVKEQLGAKLAEVGGIGYLTGLLDAAPSAAHVGYYLDIVNEKYVLRTIRDTCASIAGSIGNYSGPTDELLDSVNADMARLADLQARNGEIWSARDLVNFDVLNDPNAVIGRTQSGRITRFLCRGYSAWVVGQSHLGKSSLLMQMGLKWCMGQSFYGIAALRKLRVLYVQAENDKGDSAEQFQGVTTGMGIMEDTADFEEISERFKLITERKTSNTEFCRWLERQVILHRADVVFVDPLLSFAGVDVSRQDQCTEFLRRGVNPMLEATGVVFIAAHHTGKPKQDGRSKYAPPPTAYDLAYSGIGSSELVNWARAMWLLRSVDEETKTFQFETVKRHRSGAVHPNGEPTNILYLKHRLGAVFWERVDPPAPPEEAEESTPKPTKLTFAQEIEIKTLNTSSFLADCSKDGESMRAICSRFSDWIASKESPKRRHVAPKGSAVQGCISALIECGKLAQNNGKYCAGDNK